MLLTSIARNQTWPRVQLRRSSSATYAPLEFTISPSVWLRVARRGDGEAHSTTVIQYSLRIKTLRYRGIESRESARSWASKCCSRLPISDWSQPLTLLCGETGSVEPVQTWLFCLSQIGSSKVLVYKENVTVRYWITAGNNIYNVIFDATAFDRRSFAFEGRV